MLHIIYSIFQYNFGDLIKVYNNILFFAIIIKRYYYLSDMIKYFEK